MLMADALYIVKYISSDILSYTDRFYEYFTKIPYVYIQVLFIKTSNIFLLIVSGCVNVPFIYYGFGELYLDE